MPVKKVGNLAAGGASMAFPPSSLIFAGVQILIKAVHGVKHKYDAIIELISSLEANTSQTVCFPPSNIVLIDSQMKDFTPHLDTFNSCQFVETFLSWALVTKVL